MILPIGHEDGTVARTPWVTLAIVIACVLAHLLVLAQDEAERAVAQTWQAAADYALAHPELDADPRLLAPFGSEAAELAAAAATGDAGAGDQAHLDALTASWREALRGHPLYRWGLVPADPALPTLLTHLFLHGGWLHLFGNLLILYLSAPFLEDLWGRPLFLTFYLTAGLVAGGLYALQHRGHDGPLVGASGAVAAVLGAFLLMRGRSRIRFAVFLGFVATFSAPAWVMLPLWFLGELLDALAGDPLAAGGGVAYWAHVWGFLFGMAFAAAVRRGRPEIAASARAAAPVRLDPRLAEARRLLDRGLYPQAWELLAQAAGDADAGDEALAARWSLAVHLGREREAVAAGRELARRRLRDGRWADARPVVEQLGAALPDDPEVAALELRAAEAAAASDPAAARALLATARGRLRELPPGLLARASRLEQRLAAAAAAPTAP